MSNERIDLNQFEGVFEGGHPKHLFEEVEKRLKDGGVRTTPLYLGPQDVNAITLLPELIAELKRCYERIDNAESALREIWDHQINDVGGYNVTEILQYYKNAYGLNIEPEEQ